MADRLPARSRLALVALLRKLGHQPRGPIATDSYGSTRAVRFVCGRCLRSALQFRSGELAASPALAGRCPGRWL